MFGRGLARADARVRRHRTAAAGPGLQRSRAAGARGRRHGGPRPVGRGDGGRDLGHRRGRRGRRGLRDRWGARSSCSGWPRSSGPEARPAPAGPRTRGAPPADLPVWRPAGEPMESIVPPHPVHRIVSWPCFTATDQLGWNIASGGSAHPGRRGRPCHRCDLRRRGRERVGGRDQLDQEERVVQRRPGAPAERVDPAPPGHDVGAALLAAGPRPRRAGVPSEPPGSPGPAAGRAGRRHGRPTSTGIPLVVSTPASRGHRRAATPDRMPPSHPARASGPPQGEDPPAAGP